MAETTRTAELAESSDRLGVGIGSIQVAVLLFVFADLIMKDLLGVFPVWQLQFLRSFLGLIPFALIAWLFMGTNAFKAQRPGLHLIRGILGFIAYSTYYVALSYMPIAQTAALFYTSPILITLFSAPMLGEKLGIHRILAVVIGFCGVMVILRPDADGFNPYSLLPILCAVCYAISMIIIRRAAVTESAVTVAFYTNVSFASFSLLASGIGWSFLPEVPPDGPLNALLKPWTSPQDNQWAMLGVLALSGVLGHLLIAKAYRSAPASVIAPFDYTYLVWAPILAFLILDEVPAHSTLVGIAMIMGSGLYIGYRESRTRRRGEPLPTAESVILPNTTPRTPPASPAAEVRQGND